MDEHLLMCYGHRQSLTNALVKGDINAFRRALNSPTDVEKYDADTSMSIFERACQTPGSADFIRECIYAGCDVNKPNPEYQKRPIDFAVESFSHGNLLALLTDPTVNLDAKHSSLTPLNFLAEQITEENFENIFPCTCLLVKHGADLNIPNRRDMTPILTILKNKNLTNEKKEIVVSYLINNVANIDLDQYRKGEARMLLTKMFPNLQLPPVHNVSDENWDLNRLMQCLRNEEEAKFVHGLNVLSGKGNNNALDDVFRASDGDETLLIVATKKGLAGAVERMLRLGADINYKIRETLSPIECACRYGHCNVLEVLLKSPKLNTSTDDPLVSIVVKNIGEQVTNKCNYDRCFQLLLNHKNIDLNQADIYNCSALHYAVKYNNKNAILALLKNGAYIGVKSHFNRYTISGINAKVLEQHLDSCITTNEFRSGDDNFEIQFDYTNLVPVSTRQYNVDMATGKASQPSSDICADEMAPIDFMSKSNELRHLIKHPLIASFLFLKWHRLAFIFYVNFIMYTVFCMNILLYILLCYRQESTSRALKECLWVISLALTTFIFLRELFQLTFSPRNYLKNKENYLEIALICMIILVLGNFNFSESTRRTIAATTILLVVGEFFLLTGSLPVLSFSTHMVMLKTVSKSFIKSLLLYSIILVAFSLCFFTLLNETPKPGAVVTSGNGDEDGEDFNKFNNPGLAIVKTFVMLTGEFDAASINFNMNAWSYVIFLIFLFLISTVLFNLLNGLAVSDTQAIKSEAELTNFIHRSELMARYEQILLGNDNSTCCAIFMKLFARTRISIFKKHLPLYQIRVLPNANNQIMIPILAMHGANDLDKLNLVEGDLKQLQCTKGCAYFGGSCSCMETKIVKYALQVLEKQKVERIEEIEKENLNNRILNIENTLNEISRKLNVLLNK